MVEFKTSSPRLQSTPSFVPIKIEEEEHEPRDHFIISTVENDIRTHNDDYSKNESDFSVNSSILPSFRFNNSLHFSQQDFISHTEIKQEPANDIDISEYDDEYPEEDSDHEQTEENITENDQTNRAQHRKLNEFSQFIRRHSDYMEGKHLESYENSRINDYWKNLTTELNVIGPPIRTTAQWMRICRENYESNKRSRLAANGVNGNTGSKRIRVENRTLSGKCRI